MDLLNRRKFIEVSATASAFSLVAEWASASPGEDRWGDVLPRRQLTRNGEKVTALCLGGYHLGFTESPKEAQRLLERAIDLGVRFFDNARKYHDGRSEEYIGRFLTPRYRDQVFLMTKAHGATGKEVRQQLDDSLRALKTDHVDLWQIHALHTPQDVDERLKGGVLDAFLDAREAGKGNCPFSRSVTDEASGWV